MEINIGFSHGFDVGFSQPNWHLNPTLSFSFIAKAKKLDKAPEGLPDDLVKLPAGEPAPEVVGAKDFTSD